MKRLFVGFIMTVATIAQAEIYYWAPAGNEFNDFSDLANWKLDAELTTPATQLPGSGDRLWLNISTTGGASVNNASFDLKGGSYVLGGYANDTVTADSGVGNYLNLDLRNGTLTISDESKISQYRAVCHKLTDSATLNVYINLDGTSAGRKLEALGGATITATYDITGNSTVNIYNKCEFLQFTGKVEAGSCLAFQSGEISFNNNTYKNKYNDGRYHTYVYNKGTVRFPKGCAWVTNIAGSEYSNDADYTKAFNFYQQGGEVRLGGDFTKTVTNNDAWKRGMFFFFEGGKIVAEENASVAFLSHVDAKSGAEEVFASVSENAAVTAEPLAGAVLDMSIFTYGDGSALTKSGAGTLKLADLPPTLTVTAGTVELTKSVVNPSATFADGAKIVFGAVNNDFTTSLPANADRLDYAITADFKGVELIVKVGDQAVAEHVKTRINANMPSELSAAGIVAALEGSDVVLKRPVTVAARSFTIVAGAAAADYAAGVSVDGLLGDDSATNIVSATYTYGGYSGAAGTYDITATAEVSGRYYLNGSVAAGKLYVINESEATLFRWVASDTKVYADYADIANWMMTNASGVAVAATRPPSSIDRVYPYAAEVSSAYPVASWNYRGGTYSIGGFGRITGSPDWIDWRTYSFYLTNGTYRILNTRKLDRNSPMNFDIARSAHLDFFADADLAGDRKDANLDALGSPSVEGAMNIADGGSATIYGPCMYLRFVANVAKGGRLTFADGRYNIGNNARKNSPDDRQLNNEGGTISFPNGMDWVGGAAWADGWDTKVININQNAGELRLGGDVKKSYSRSHVYNDDLYFRFNGGKMVSEAGKSVTFIQHLGPATGEKPSQEEIHATVGENADVTVETCSGSTLDLSIFAYGEGAKLTKTGPGTLKLADLPPTFVMSEGTNVFTTALTNQSCQVAADATDATFVFGAVNNALSGIANADRATYTLDASAYSATGGDVILESADAELLQTVKDRFVLPASLPAGRYEVTLESGKLYLSRIRTGLLILYR